MKVLYKDGIACTSQHVRVEGLHPVLRERITAFMKDPAVRSNKRNRGRIAVVSGVRTEAEQRQLYKCWKEKERRIKAGIPLGSYVGYNLAANPDRPWGGQSGRNVGKGSRHQTQFDGYGYAIDFRIDGGLSWGTVWSVAQGYGLVFPLKDNKAFPEAWHCVPINGNVLNSWVPAPNLGDQKVVVDDIQTISNKLFQGSSDIGRTMLHKGARGDLVRTVQARLHDLGWAQPKDIDGIFGPKTFQMVKTFQNAAGLTVDGIVGPQTWGALMSRNAPRMPLLKLPRHIKKTQIKPKHRPKARGFGVVPHKYRGVPYGVPRRF